MTCPFKALVWPLRLWTFRTLVSREPRGARTVVIFGTSEAWRARQFESIRLKSYKPTVFIFSQSQKERNANFIKAHVSIQSYHLKQQLLSKSTSRPSHGNYNVFSFFPSSHGLQHFAPWVWIKTKYLETEVLQIRRNMTLHCENDTSMWCPMCKKYQQSSICYALIFD